MIDKRLLKDKIIVKKVTDKNDFGDETYSEPITVESVRFDRSISVSGNRGKYTNSSVSNVTVDDSWLEAVVNDGERDYTITGYQPNFVNGKAFSFEIEVI